MVRMLAVVLVLVGAGVARANPVTLTIDDHELHAELRSLVEQLEEPVGMLAPAPIPKLGLERGDIVRAINGSSPARPAATGSVLYLDVLRAGKPVVVRLAIKLGPHDGRIDRDRLRERLQRVDPARDHGFTFRQVTRNGRPSGVLIGVGGTGLFGYGLRALEEGDLIRKIDHKPVDTVAAAIAALQASVDRAQIVLEADRAGQTFTYTLQLEDGPKYSKNDPALDAVLAKIKRVDDRSYLVPAELVDLVVNDPMATAKGARIVPAIKDGKPAGFKLYAIRPSSLYAALGLHNGDTIRMINGHELSTAEKALEVYSKIRTAKQIKVDIERRGKPLTLVWKVRK